MTAPRLARDTMLYALSGVATKMIGVLLLPLLTRLLTPADYGAIDLIALWILLAIEFVALGSDYVIALYYHDEDADRRRLVGSALGMRLALGAIVAGLLWLATPLLAPTIGHEEAVPAAIFAALTMPGTALLATWMAILRQEGRAWLLVAVSIGKVALTAALTVGLLLALGGSLRAYFGAALIVDWGLALGLWIALRGMVGAPKRSLMATLAHKGAAYLPRSMYFIAMTLITRQMLYWWGDLGTVGAYAVAVKVSFGIWVIITAAVQAWLPYSMAIARNPEAPAIYARSLERYCVGVGAGVAALALFAPEILRVVATEEYAGAAGAIGWQALSLMAVGGISFVTTGLNIAKETGVIGRVAIATAGLNIALAALLIPRLGGEGAAMAAAFDQGAALIALYWAAQRRYPLPFRTRRLLLWAGAIIGVVALASVLPGALSWWLVALKAALWAAYAALLWASGGISTADIRAIKVWLGQRLGRSAPDEAYP